VLLRRDIGLRILVEIYMSTLLRVPEVEKPLHNPSKIVSSRARMFWNLLPGCKLVVLFDGLEQQPPPAKVGSQRHSIILSHSSIQTVMEREPKLYLFARRIDFEHARLPRSRSEAS
jgi:hypothetical protein